MKLHTLSKGDPIEIKFATHDGYLWRPATVCYVDDLKVTVAYSDGSREDVPHRQSRYRFSENHDYSLT